VNGQFWWFVTRASGMVAAVLIGLTVIWGLLVSTRLIPRKGLPAWLVDLHRGLAGLSLVFVAVHLFAIWVDSYEEFTVVELFVPFASDWKPAPVAWGVLAVWLLAVVQISSWFQRRLPRRRWHLLHLLSFPLAVLVGVHAVTAGTDADNPWFVAVTVGLAAGMCVLTIHRLRNRGSQRSRASAASLRRPADGGSTKILHPPPYRPAVASERTTDLL